MEGNNTLNSKGQVRNRDFATQHRDYSKLRYGNITPTDLDGLIEYRGTKYVLIETKFVGDRQILSLDELFSYGQLLALERLCDDLQSRKETILVVTGHSCTTKLDIDMAETNVLWFRKKRVWKRPEQPITLKKIVDDFLLNNH